MSGDVSANSGISSLRMEDLRFQIPSGSNNKSSHFYRSGISRSRGIFTDYPKGA